MIRIRIKLSRAIIYLLVILLIINIVIAANDPGHDTLYIEESGDSELDGNFNITGNVSAEDIIFSGVALDIRGDDEEAGTNNRIIGINGNGISIQSVGSIYINTLSGTSGTVYLGDGADSVNINITGALFFGADNELDIAAAAGAATANLYWGNKLLCNTSQSNCGWATTATEGGDITSVQDGDKWLDGGANTGAVTLTFNESELNNTIDARSDGAVTDLWLNETGDTATGNFTFGADDVLHIDDTNNYVGIGTATPGEKLDVVGDIRANTGDLLSYRTSGNPGLVLGTHTSPTSSTSSQEGLQMYYDITNDVAVFRSLRWGTSYYDFQFRGRNIDFQTGTGSVSSALVINSSGNIGIGTTSPTATLHINGTLNATGDICEESSGVCLSAAGAGGDGNITGTGTDGTLAKFTAAGVIGNSIVSESGNTLSIAGNITMPNSFYIGANAEASDSDTTAIGRFAIASDNDATAIGGGARATGGFATSLGRYSNASGADSTSLGSSSTASASYALAVGRLANATADSTIAIGRSSQAQNTSTIAIGYAANATGLNSVAIGLNSDATVGGTIAIGNTAQSDGTYTIAIGDNAGAIQNYDLAIGGFAEANATGATAIGTYSKAIGVDAGPTAVGYQAYANRMGAIAIGWKANASNQYAIAMGRNSKANETHTIAIGYQTNATENYAIAIGKGTQATAQDAIVIGRDITNSVANSTKFGGKLIVNGDVNLTGYNISTVECIHFDSGGKICSGS